METIDALGVKINALAPERVFSLIEKYLLSSRYHQIATCNPDFIMAARKNPEFKNVLNTVDLALADGVGIHLPAFLQGKTLPGRIPGADLTEYVLAFAEKNRLTVSLLARRDGLSSAQETKEALLHKYPNLLIRGRDVDIRSLEDMDQALEETDSHIVLANFGAPVQDIFLSRLRILAAQGKKIRLAMGVGGTFDFITGKQKRAPLFFRKAGLEWLWRLALQPVRRSKKTFNYVVVYSFLCFREALGQLRSAERPFLSRNIAKVSIFFGLLMNK